MSATTMGRGRKSTGTRTGRRPKYLAAAAAVVVLGIAADAAYGLTAASATAMKGPGAQTAVAPRSRTTSVVTAEPATAKPASAASGSWTSDELLIRAGALGKVRVGTTVAEAEVAAGEAFNSSGDGFMAHEPVASNRNYLYVGISGNGSASSTVYCVGAFEQSTQQTVVTPEGFRLGQSTTRLLQIYGTKAQFFQGPAYGMDPYSGYVVHEDGGTLVFRLDHAGEYVDGLMAGGPKLDPEGCGG